MLTKREIDHVEMWFNVYKHSSRVNKSDVRLANKLDEMRKEINHNNYLKRKATLSDG